MSIGLVIQVKGIGADKYDAIMKEINLSESNATWPDGVISHVAGSTSDGWCVVDVWESRDHFDKFFADRLKPAFDRVGGMPEPQIIQFQVHNAHKHG